MYGNFNLKDMTLEFINELLIKQGENPVLLDECVLNIRKGRGLIYSLSGDTDYVSRVLEICYDDNHDIIWKGWVKTKQELENVVLEKL